MTIYIPSQELVQAGLEAVYGDLAAPTVQLMGITDCKIIPHPEGSQIIDKRGTTMPAYISTIDRLWAEANLSGVVCYTQFNYWLDCLFGIDASNPYGYLAELDPTTTIQSLNLLHGQPDVTYSMGGGIVDRLTIRGSNNGPLTFTAHLLGMGSVPDVIEGALTDSAVVVAMGNHCAFWIDPIAGPIGTTPVLTTAFTFEADIIVDRKLVWHMGALNPDSFRHGKWLGSKLKLNLQMTSDMQDILDEIMAEEVSPHGYVVRIRATDALTTSIFTLDFAGEALTSPQLYTYSEGVVTLELELAAKFTSDATFLSCWGADLVLP